MKHDIKNLVDRLAKSQVAEAGKLFPEYRYPSAFGSLTAHFYLVLDQMKLTKKQLEVLAQYVESHSK
jgi:hypothetical protein